VGLDGEVVLAAWLEAGFLGEEDVARLVVDAEERRVCAVQHLEPGDGAGTGGGLARAVQRTRHSQVVVRRLCPKHSPCKDKRKFYILKHFTHTPK